MILFRNEPYTKENKSSYQYTYDCVTKKHQHIASPVSYLGLFRFLKYEYNPKTDKIINPKIAREAGLVSFNCCITGNVCTANIAAPKAINIANLDSILDSSLLSKLFKSPLVATLSKEAFKACTCALACLSGTPLVTKSSYTCKVSICTIVNHLIKSVSNTISKLFQNVNTFLNFQEGIYTWQ